MKLLGKLIHALAWAVIAFASVALVLGAPSMAVIVIAQSLQEIK